MHDVAERIARIIVSTLEAKTPRLAVALLFQVGQSEPDVLLCHESFEHFYEDLKKRARPDVVNADIARLAKTRDEAVAQDRMDWLYNERASEQIGYLFNTGNWVNPADPVILDGAAEPEIHAWAKSAFGALEARYDLPEAEQTPAFYAAEQHIRDVLWAAIDHARKTFSGNWPPIAFVASQDDEMMSILELITLRAIPLRDQR
jgi:hypothetical protein